MAGENEPFDFSLRRYYPYQVQRVLSQSLVKSKDLKSEFKSWHRYLLTFDLKPWDLYKDTPKA